MSKSKRARYMRKHSRHAGNFDENREGPKIHDPRKNPQGPWEEEEGETPDAPSGLSGMPEPSGGPLPA